VEEIEKLYMDYKDDVYRYLVSLTKNPDLSEDLLSETFVSAISSISNFKGQSSVKTWLFSIARNMWLQKIRKERNIDTVDKSHFGKGGIKMKISCDVILDLIPLVKDGVASDDSSTIVKEHIKNCESCRAEFDIFESNRIEQSSISDQKIISAIKRSIFITQLAILTIGAIIGTALTNSMGMFYNFIIMPVIGGVALLVFKRKWYYAPIAVFLLSYLWQTIRDIILDGFTWIILYSRFYFSAIYAILVCLGVVIVMLLKYAFKKEGE